jgi:hypothetical protein
MSLSALDAQPAPRALPPLPEQGRVVEVRGGAWAVTEVIEH